MPTVVNYIPQVCANINTHKNIQTHGHNEAYKHWIIGWEFIQYVL